MDAQHAQGTQDGRGQHGQAQHARARAAWPSLRVDEWADTRTTLHMWTQVVGKVRLMHAPLLNHWWQVPLYVSPRGLTTSSIPFGTRVFDMEFDSIDHQLRIRDDDGATRHVALEPKSVADFYSQVMQALDELGLERRSMPGPTRSTRRSRSRRTARTPPMTPTPRSASGASWCRPTAS